MPLRPQLLLRGLVKLVAVVAAASLAGIALGAGLAKLSNDEPSDRPLAQTSAPTRTSARPVAATAPATTTGAALPSTTAPATATTPTSTPVGTADPDVSVEVLDAQLGTPSPTTGHARVSTEIRVTNRATTPVQITTAVLITGDFNVPLDSGGRDAAAALLTPIAAGAKATGRLRFTTDTAVTQRLLAKPTAHLRIADLTIELPLKSTQGTTTTG